MPLPPGALLRHVALLHVLRLVLVPLLHLPLLRLAGIAALDSLVLLLLSLFELLALLRLPLDHLILLLLDCAVALGVAGRGRSRALQRRQLARMNRRSAIRSTGGPGGYHAGIAKLRRPWRGSDGRLALIGRGA